MKRKIGLVVAGAVIVTAASLRFLPLARRAAPLSGERINVLVPLTYQQDRRVLIGSESIRIDTIYAAAETDVVLSGERGVRPDQMSEVMDLLKAAGVKRIALQSI